jgi:hypothetical protein
MIVQIGGYICLLAVWSFVSIQALLRKQQTKEAAVYGGLMGVAAVIGSLLMAGVNIASVVSPYTFAFQSLGNMILKK